MKHKLINFGYDDTKLDSERKQYEIEQTSKRTDSKSVRIGTHDFVIKLITKHLKMACNVKEDRRYFEEKIGELKQLRVNADYLNVEITKEHAAQSCEFSERINNVLNLHLNE